MGRHSRESERGASLVEFALVVPLLLLLVLGIVELGFVLAQMNEVRHGAREGARYAAVSRPDYDGGGGVGDSADVLAVTCDAIGLPGISVEVTLDYDDADGSGSPERLEYGTVTIVADTDSLSGVPLVADFLPDTLSNSATFRLEQDGAWAGFVDSPCP